MNNIYLPWHESQWQVLQKRSLQNKLPHALILNGPQGVGKTIFAKKFADFLLCENTLSENSDAKNQACNCCKSCQLIKAGSHPDLLVIMPEEEGKGIKVDAVRGIVKFVNQSAHFSKYKVIIIQPADKMNINAANALLKSLEEPSAKTVIILTTDRMMSLPATVRSRCQIIPFPAPNQDIALDWLRTQNIAHDNLQLLLELANGAPLKVLDFIENDILDFRKKIFKQLFDLLQEKTNVVSLSQEWQKLDIQQIVLHLVSWIMDIIRIKNIGDPQLVNFDFDADLHKIAAKYDAQKLYKIYDDLVATQNLLHRQANLNSQLMLEGLLAGFLFADRRLL